MVDKYEFETDELVHLELACRQADDLGRLEEVIAGGISAIGVAGQERLSGAVAEARQARLAIARLLGGLALPSASADERPLSAAGLRAKKAADVRWTRERALRGERAG